MNRGFSKQTTPVSFLTKLRTFLLGKSLDPLNPKVPRNMLLAAFLAWIGLGADGLSSACYGPEAAYLALGQYTHFAIYLAIAIAVTVFIIAIGYNQVIELFPTGGGGYKVATKLIGPMTGLASGVALIVDYVLTISISLASSIDAIFSLLPIAAQSWKLTTEIVLLAFLGLLNLRGIKDPIKILMPIFLTFFISHCLLIAYGVFKKMDYFPTLVTGTVQETIHVSQNFGWLFFLAILLRAYSLGGGTYTGIEAVSSNVQRLETPRIQTGKLAMFYIAFSLALTAGGIIFLYLLWNVTPVSGQTLNAAVFNTIIQDFSQSFFSNNAAANEILFFIVMASEAGLLFVAANAGYIGGPTTLSNMALDNWVPSRFKHLSSRLVTQNGIILMGLSSFFILIWTKGDVETLIVMYSINVFITFSLSLFGLSIYWLKAKRVKTRLFKFALSLLGFIVTASILTITITQKFTEGGWVTLSITALLIILCAIIKKRYANFQEAMHQLSEQFKQKIVLPAEPSTVPLDPKEPTAVIFIGEHLGVGMCTLNTVLNLFPNQYKNFVFLSVGEIDFQSYDPEFVSRDPEKSIHDLKMKTAQMLDYFVNYCHKKKLPATYFQGNNIDVIEGLTALARKVQETYSNCVFFSGKLIFEYDSWINHWLHNHTATLVEQRLQTEGMYMMLIPIQPNYAEA